MENDIVKMLFLSRQRQRKKRKIKTISGAPPLSFKAKAGALKNYRIYGSTETKTRSYSGSAPLSFPIEDGSVSNYRIYGNTESGESVGDRTENLFDENDLSDGSLSPTDGTTIISNSQRYTITYIPVNGSQNYTLTARGKLRVHQYSLDYSYLGSTIEIGTFITNANAAFIRLAGAKSYFEGATMLNEGSTALPYEPYGYRIPITNNSETANIYLDEPLRMVGDEVECVDYATQKRYNADGTSEDVSLPALPAQSSTNSLSVGTEVQPSSVAVDVAEVVSCGDKVTDSQSVNYGKYKIPVTLTADSAETTDIYLDTPLRKVGNESDYIDYATQKRRNSDGTESSVTLPEIAVTAGTNTLTVGTEVQPSGVEITGRIKKGE